MKNFGNFSEKVDILISRDCWMRRLDPTFPLTLMRSGERMVQLSIIASIRKAIAGKLRCYSWKNFRTPLLKLTCYCDLFRLALRVLSLLFSISGQSKTLEEFANAPTLEEQRRLYEKSIRPVLVSGTFVKLVLSNPIFLWNSLGVPMNQLAVLTKETSKPPPRRAPKISRFSLT